MKAKGKYRHFAEEIKATEPGLNNTELGAKVKARIAMEDPAPTQYDIHGRPDPMSTGTEITSEVRDNATIIIGENKEDLMIQYIRRTAPAVCNVIVDVKTGGHTFHFNKRMRGEPIGVMVAFMNGQALLIGWSKYNFKKDKDTGKQIEQLVFTKKDAVQSAVLRALTTELDSASIPFKIADKLPAFIKRAKKYFKVEPSNVAGEVSTVGYA
jgi:hypothetical protein